jgi:hypothetical protein
VGADRGHCKACCQLLQLDMAAFLLRNHSCVGVQS